MIAVVLLDGGLGSSGVMVPIVAMEIVDTLFRTGFLLPILVCMICGLVGCNVGGLFCRS